MKFDNVNLWFAKDENGNIVIIDEVDKDTRNEYKFYCPICGSEIRPKQGDINIWHFAHEDKTKCDGESRIHWWVKNKLIDIGTKFIVKTDKEKEYICKEFYVEKSYEINENVYKPDLVVETECGETIFFEIEHTNKKKPEDYMSVWIDLNNIVVEVNTKELINSNYKILPVFKALFYDGKCREVNKGNLYYNTIGIHSEKILKENNYDLDSKVRIKKLNWLWMEILKYKKNESGIVDIIDLIDNIEDRKDIDIIVNLLKKPKCSNVMLDYVEYKISKYKSIIKDYVENLKELNSIIEYDVICPRIVFDRICFGMEVTIKIIGFGSINDNIKTENELVEILDLIYKNQIIYHKSKEVIDKINHQYKYENLCNYIDDIENPEISIRQYGTTSSYITVYDRYKDIKLNDYDFNIFRKEESIKELLENIIKDCNIQTPFNIKTVNKLNSLTKNIRDKCNQKLSKYSWNVSSYLRYNHYSLTYYIESSDCKKEYIVISTTGTDKIKINECEILIDDIEEVEKLIIKEFENTRENVITTSDNVYKAIEYLKSLHNSLHNYKIISNYSLSPSEEKLFFNFQEDESVFYLKENKLYKHSREIYDFNNCTIEKIVDVLNKIIKTNLYIEVCESNSNDIAILIEKINNRLRKINGSYHVNCEVNNNYKVFLKNKNNKILDEIIINEFNFEKENLDNKIMDSFSEKIRRDKYGIN